MLESKQFKYLAFLIIIKSSITATADFSSINKNTIPVQVPSKGKIVVVALTNLLITSFITFSVMNSFISSKFKIFNPFVGMYELNEIPIWKQKIIGYLATGFIICSIIICVDKIKQKRKKALLKQQEANLASLKEEFHKMRKSLVESHKELLEIITAKKAKEARAAVKRAEEEAKRAEEEADNKAAEEAKEVIGENQDLATYAASSSSNQTMEGGVNITPQTSEELSVRTLAKKFHLLKTFNSKK